MDPARRGEKSKLIVYSDDVLLAAGAKSLIERTGLFDVTTADPETSTLVPQVALSRPSFVLLDTTPDMTIGLFAAILQAAPGTRVVLWTRSFSEELLEQCLDLGISDFLQRGCKEDAFLEQMTKLASGEHLSYKRQTSTRTTKVELTPRESQLVSLLAQGIRNKEIANCLGITEGTVRIYLSKLFIKVGARDRFELAVFGLKNAFCGSAFWDGQNAYVSDLDEDRARPVMRSLVLVEPKRRSGYPQTKQVVAA